MSHPEDDATTAEIVTLHPSETTSHAGATEAAAWDDRDKLRELWRLLILRLIDALSEPYPKASMLNVARQFLHDQGPLNEDEEEPPAPSQMASALAKWLERDELPFKLPDDD